MFKEKKAKGLFEASRCREARRCTISFAGRGGRIKMVCAELGKVGGVTGLIFPGKEIGGAADPCVAQTTDLRDGNRLYRAGELELG